MNPSLDTSNAVLTERYIETPSSTTKNTFLYVQETGWLKSLYSHICRREHVDSYLILYVLSGSGYITYREKRTKVTSGACLYIDCQESYSHESFEDSQWELLWVHFNGNAAKSYYEYYCRFFSNIIYPENKEAVCTILHTILTTTKEKSSFYEASNACSIIQLLTTLITTPKNTLKPTDKIPTLENKLEQIHQYLTVHYTEPLTLDQLAHEFYISKYYLSREFKKYYGESLISYLNHIRINHAKELLRFSEKKISNIAEDCGITDFAYFTKLFKGIEGMTPLEYRKLWKGLK